MLDNITHKLRVFIMLITMFCIINNCIWEQNFSLFPNDDHTFIVVVSQQQ